MTDVEPPLDRRGRAGRRDPRTRSSPKVGLRARCAGSVARIERSNVWRSMFRHPTLDTPRGRALQSFSNFFLHLYPVKIPARVLRLRYSFRLGFIATVLFGILVVTGVYLMFFYTPAVGSAYGDMQHLRTGVGFGQLVRNVHRWSAHLMVLVVVLHLARTFFAGAYKKPREFNWVLGVVLLLLTLGALVHRLPAAVGPAQLLGGHRRHQPRALRAAPRRTAAEPADRRRPDRPDHAAALLRAARRRAARRSSCSRSASTSGGCARTASPSSARRSPADRHVRGGGDRRARRRGARRRAPGDLYGGRTRVLGVVDRESVTAEERAVDDTVFTWPHLLVRHVVVALGVAAAVLALGVAFAAPLRGLANPNLTPEPAKAPWYFAGLQELLSHFDPLVAGILVPARRGPDARAAALHRPQPLDRGPPAQGGDRHLLRAARCIAVVLTVVGTFFRGPGWQFIAPWTHWYVEL